MGACQCIPAVKDGHSYWVWAGRAFSACAYSDMEKAALMLGLMNILLWLVAQLPQLVQTFKEKQVDSISFGLFACWLLGDLTNLLGCILTNAYSTQLYTAVYFCAIDVVMVGQYLWYKKFYRKVQSRRDEVGKLSIIPVMAFVGLIGLRTMTASSDASSRLDISNGRTLYNFANEPDFAYAVTGNATDNTTQQCDYTAPVGDVANDIGIACAWISATLYFVSRIPQVVKNYQRKNVDGLNPFMFLVATAANTCYGLSIILNQPPINDDFYESKLPYIVGSMGTLIFDVTILIEYRMYNRAGKRRHGYDIIQ